ncbi:hypothetical protein CKO25_18760 [Thiocapsa imhoffii]|uniref:CheR-type methyltransferase domain-containing protein n=1 Tax=Thiocapsa imhoffii TaxID=382777 RepID=A0A9X0WMJ3_9GAMM|nr:protein-glutamate O-methyltransferase CheR [Thiocapsa imhoffii]MBK1646642.1 hypothetical protein [Thiocapsa imhoffii]
MNLDAFKQFVKEQLGLHFGEDAHARLQALLAGRIAATATASTAHYLALAAEDPRELQRLTSLLTVNETYFYREPQHLQLLTEHLIPSILKRQEPGQRIRILSLGCSTGEEPYSIAIALRERFGDQAERLFQIQAADVDEEVLERARAAIYGPFAFRALPAELRERWFTAIDPTHRRLDQRIRQQVAFRSLNLFATPYPQSVAAQDIIFFRNVSIYFDSDTRKIVLTRLRDLLNPHGALIVGTSETLANDFGILRLHAIDGVFLFSRATTGEGRQEAAGAHHKWDTSRARSHPQPPPVGKPPPTPARAIKTALDPAPPRPRTKAPVRGDTRADQAAASTNRAPAAHPPRSSSQPDQDHYARALAAARAERFQDALNALAPLIKSADVRAEHLALKAHLLLEQGDTQGAEAAAEQALSKDPWCADALLLRGRCERLRGHAAAAIRTLRRVVYDRPDCWRAHYQLAETYRESGEPQLARREYRIVLRQLEDETRALQSVAALPSLMSVKDLRFLCETRLAQLADSAA